jgi:zinc transport system ATP-binding protein
LPLVTATQIEVQFGQKTVLSGVDLTVKKREIVTLIGPNGAGKSTLVRVILGLVRPNRGQVTLAKGLRIGYMPQKLMIEPLMPLSVFRFLQLAGNIAKKDIEATLGELMIGHLSKNSMESISGGEFQRVLLARALIREPNQGVDVTGQEELYQLMMHIRNTRHCAILMVSHDLHLVMAGTDKVVCLNKHICCSGHPKEISQHPEFLNLFGAQKRGQLMIYAHEHNHQHDLGGDLCT